MSRLTKVALVKRERMRKTLDRHKPHNNLMNLITMPLIVRNYSRNLEKNFGKRKIVGNIFW